MGQLKKYLNNRMTIYRAEDVKDDHGGVQREFVKNSWEIPCRIYALAGPSYEIKFNGTNYLVSDKIMCTKDINIRVGDKIVDDNDSTTYLIIRKKSVFGRKRISHIECHIARTEAE